ncbi:pyridoxamine 5'-phosphate oxidase family protein [Candidatus Omnitrophota bacterium]
MQSEGLKDRIFKVIKDYPIGSMATIKEDRPWVRYMVMQPQQDLTLYTTSFTASRKIAQIRKNNNVHVTFGADPKNWALPYVNVDGAAEVLTDPESKKKCWNEMLSKYFKGPEDPGYIVIKVRPRAVEYWGPGAREPEVYTV